MYIPKDIWLVKHGSRDISFFIPKPDEEVNTTQATFEKRQKTALSWASGGPYSQRVPVEQLVKHEFSNDFEHGFKFITTSSRWQTEAEYIVIKHPNGYSFEIYTSNLLEVLRADGCAKGGVLNGKYKMFYNMNGKWSIFSEGSSLEPEMVKLDQETRAANSKKKKAKSIKLLEGMVVKIGDGGESWTYVGKHELSIEGSMGELHYKNLQRLGKSVVFGTKKWEFSGGVCTVTSEVREIETNWQNDNYQLSESSQITSQEFQLEILKLMTFVTQSGKICQFKSKSVYINPVDDGNKFNHELVERFKSGKKFSLTSPTYNSSFDYSDMLIKVGYFQPKGYYRGYSYSNNDSVRVQNLDGAAKIGDTWKLYQHEHSFETIGSGNWGGFTNHKNVKFKIKEST